MTSAAGPPAGLPAPLAARVRDWLAADPDPADRAELTRLRTAAAVDPTALAELEERFGASLRCLAS
jgi:phosphomannomutase